MEVEEGVIDAFSSLSKLDSKSLDILKAISIHGPRNLAYIADKVNIPPTTVRYRVNQMLSQHTLFFHLNPYHTNMGLKKAIVFAEAAQGHEDFLLKCLQVNKFWIYLFRCYGPYEGCGGVWTIPINQTIEYERFLSTLEEAGVAKAVHLYWSTCFQNVPVTKKWFDREKGSWVLNWDEWLDEVQKIEGELPDTLRDPDDWPIKADYVDLLIIKELEKDAKITFPNLSRILKIPLETIKYHYREHIMKRRLLESYQVIIYRFPFAISEMLFFVFKFDSYDNLTKFALSMLDKPFSYMLGKVLKENMLISHIFLPRTEFRNFVMALSTLVRKGFLREYTYVFQDMRQTWRVTIPYEFFKDGDWNYDHLKHINELEKVIEEYHLTDIESSLSSHEV